MLQTAKAFFFLVLACVACDAACAQGLDKFARNYGAIPNDNIDDYQALQNAIADLQDDDSLVLEPGRYDLWNTVAVPRQPLAAFSFALKNRVSVYGHGAELRMYGFNPNYTPINSWPALFSCNGCTDLRFEDFSVSMETLPFSQLRITAINAGQGAFDANVESDPLQVPLQTQVLNTTMFTFYSDGLPRTGSINNPASGFDWHYAYADWTNNGGSFVVTANATSTTPQTVHVVFPTWNNMNQGISQLAVGDIVAVRHGEEGAGTLFYMVRCSGTSFKDITVSATPGNLVSMYACHGIYAENFNAAPEPGMVLVGPTNGINLLRCTGTATFSGCHLLGTGDDGIAVSNVYMKINSGVSNGQGGIQMTLDMLGATSGIYSALSLGVGEEITIVDSDLAPVQTAAMTTGANIVFNGVTLPFVGSPPWTVVVPNSQGLTLPLSTAWRAFPSTYTLDSLSITNCEVGKNRGRAIWVTSAENMVVMGCNLHDSSWSCIELSEEDRPLWYAAGGLISNVTISSTAFGKVHSGTDPNLLGVLSLPEARKNNPFPNNYGGPINSNVVVDNCVFSSIPSMAINCCSSKSVRITNNAFATPGGSSYIALRSCDYVVVSGNINIEGQTLPVPVTNNNSTNVKQLNNSW